MKSKERQFSGPLFVMGMPRSGTKLLRELLNRNPDIGIPSWETHFIPYFVKKYGVNVDFFDDQVLRSFYDDIVSTTFFEGMKSEGYLLTWDRLSKEADKENWATVLEFIIRFYSPADRNTNFIWGDKTPGYLNHINLLIKLFPNAKFLNIIRDPRDYCLSVKKTWGKSIYRAAERWRHTLGIARRASSRLSNNDYMEVFYESLLEAPQKVLHNICEFIQCGFISEMLTLTKPSENFSETKSATEIVRSNVNKYLGHLSTSEIKRIEEIIYPIGKSYHYHFHNEVQFKPLNTAEYTLYTLYDGIASLKFHLKQLGLKNSLSFFVRHYFQSSWRRGGMI